MTQGRGDFCTRCGTPFIGDNSFCTKCGTPRRQPSPAGTTPSAPPQATSFQASAAFGTVAQAAGAATAFAAVPWQTIIAGQTPDLRAMLAMAATPTLRGAVQASLRKPGLSMAATTVLDVAVAVITGGTGALAAVIPRAVGGGLTSLLSLVTGTKGGTLRKVTGAVSLVTALVQVVSLGMTLMNRSADASLLSIAPMAVATASALLMALKTASVALRRRS